MATFIEVKTWQKEKGQAHYPKRSWVGDSGSIKSHLEKEYEITNNSDDYVAARELIDYLVKTCKLPMSDTKIGIDLRKVVKLVRDIKRENGKSLKIWKGKKKYG